MATGPPSSVRPRRLISQIPGDADDSVQLKLREQEHALDEIVVGGPGTAEDEAEDRPERDVDQRHGAPTSGKITR
jgi:hypothetical protein